MRVRSHSLEVAEGGRLVVGAWRGRLRVRAAEGSAVSIAIAAGNLAVEVEQDGNDVYIGARLPWSWLPVWTPPVLDVRVPRRYSVEATACDGGVEVHGVRGEVEARSRGGRLCLSGVRGTIDARTASGSIGVSDCRGEVDLATQRGAIEIRGVEGRVAAHTRGGRISVLDAAGELLLDSGGGPVQIEGVRAWALDTAASLGCPAPATAC